VALKKGFGSVMDFLSSTTHSPTEKMLATRLSAKNGTKICGDRNNAMVNIVYRECVGPEMTETYEAKLENPLAVENKHNLEEDYSGFIEYGGEEERVAARHNGQRKDNEDSCKADKGRLTLYNTNVRRSERQRLRKESQHEFVDEKGRQSMQRAEHRHVSLETMIDKKQHFIDWNKFPDGICVLIDYKPSS